MRKPKNAIEALDVIRILEEQVSVQDKYIRLLEKRINRMQEEVRRGAACLRVSGGKDPQTDWDGRKKVTEPGGWFMIAGIKPHPLIGPDKHPLIQDLRVNYPRLKAVHSPTCKADPFVLQEDVARRSDRNDYGQDYRGPSVEM